ncbi:MAG: ATP-binding protein [Gammaproteobacteria bacterium]|nr:ATP-binding protein [Gammaproteobacteria bacterium]
MRHHIESLDDIRWLRENKHVECKLAIGRDGNGELPHDVWETYSAFANTAGGEIFLGLRELPDMSYQLVGIRDINKVLEQFFDGLNNPRIVNQNILTVSDVEVIQLMGRELIQIYVPPVDAVIYINGDPERGAYRREGNADKRIIVD